MTEARRTPWVAQVILLVVFAAFVGIGVFTVVIPELADDGDPSDGAPTTEAEPEPED